MQWKSHYWLDYPKFARNLTRKLTDTELVGTRYFTSRIDTPESKRRRQNNYLEVLELRGNIDIIYGNYRESNFECSGCRRPNFIPNEKQTDVNIAVEMMLDAYLNRYDVALLVGGDSDLVPAVRAVKSHFKKQIICCFPPKRHSKELKLLQSGEIHFTEVDLKNSQLPDEVRRPDGYVYVRPDSRR